MYLINFNEIDNNCDNKTIKKHDDVLIDIDKAGSIISYLI
jgi:uncharacterized protein YuzE